MMKTIREYTGKSGGRCAYPKLWVGWGSEIYSLLIWLCSQNRFGDFSVTQTLCARVLRARYHPDGRLLNARLKSGSSYTWQSILAGRDCFKHGYIWRVGDGTQIKIWEDSWIRTSHNLKIQRPEEII